MGSIDALKEDLRKIAEERGQGFTEEIDGGSVQVTTARKREFKGIMPVLNAEAWLALPEKRQDALVEQGLVVLEQQWASASRPSVTVRL